MTTNQDSPNTAGAAELKACPNPWCDLDEPSVSRNNALGRWTWQVECLCGISDGELHETEADAIAAWNRRAENPSPCPSATPEAHAVMNPQSGGVSAPLAGQLYNASAVPDEVVEAILFHVEHVCGPLNTEPCVILGDDDRSVLASAIRAALIAERDRLAERCERLEEALLTIKHEAERENGRWVHMKRCIAVQTKAALKEPRP